MPKKITVNLDAHTSSQKTFIVDPHQNSANTIEDLFTKEDFLEVLDKVILTPVEKSSSKETKKTSE